MTDRIFLIRHGRTPYNVADRLRGLADPELDDAGVAQARAIGVALLDAGLAEVRCSPLHRTMATAEIIAETAGIPVMVEPAFTDRDYGQWAGQLRSAVIEQWGSVDAAPGVEPVTNVLDRVWPALQELADADRSGLDPIAVVTHDAVIKPVLARIRPDLQPAVPNASWAVLGWDGARWSVISADQTPSAGDYTGPDESTI